MEDKSSSRIYYELVGQETSTALLADIWSRKLGRHVTYDEMNTFFSQNYSLTNSSKLRTLRYLILYYRLTLNPYLLKCKIKNTVRCTFCNLERETTENFYWLCNKTREFWNEFVKIIEAITYVKSSDLSLTLEVVITNTIHTRVNNIANLTCLIAKRYLYRIRCKNI